MPIKDKVLSFYSELPFNIKESFNYVEQNINFYHPQLTQLCLKNKNIVDIGCGPGHLINAINYKLNNIPFYLKTLGNIKCKGIDFNPTAIIFGLQYSNKYKLGTDFCIKNVFDLQKDDFYPSKKTIMIMSNGALHHTKDCLKAIEVILKESIKSKEKVSFLIGLYHLHGRKPFLDHFRKLKLDNHKENFLKNEFHKLRGITKDKLNDESWFQDQVNHPLETQHTLSEIYPLFADYNFNLINTSLDKFNYGDISEIIEAEKHQFEIGSKALEEGRYFPGYFTCLFEKS
tara:strand:+ start:424 stop:1284 length:861 start_codon:yes stop_codon:yes gene_type:complete